MKVKELESIIGDNIEKIADQLPDFLDLYTQHKRGDEDISDMNVLLWHNIEEYFLSREEMLLLFAITEE